MKRLLLLGAMIVALGAAGVVVQIFFSPLVYAGCPVAPP
jgi:hypothetical protein